MNDKLKVKDGVVVGVPCPRRHPGSHRFQLWSHGRPPHIAATYRCLGCGDWATKEHLLEVQRCPSRRPARAANKGRR